MSRLNKTPNFDQVTADISAKARAAHLPQIWHAITDEQRGQWVKPLMEVGHSNGTAAKALGFGASNKVAGVRTREKIPSRNEPKGGRSRKASEDLENVVELRTKK